MQDEKGCDTHKWDYTSFCQTNIVGGIYGSTRAVFEARTWRHIFFLVFSPFIFFPFFFPSFFYLSREPSTDLDRRPRGAFPFLDVTLRRDSHDATRRDASSPSLKKSTSEYVSGLPDFALRPERFRIMDRTDRRFRTASFFPQPPIASASSPGSHVPLTGPKTSPFQSHSIITFFILTLLSVKFRPHNPDSSFPSRTSGGPRDTSIWATVRISKCLARLFGDHTLCTKATYESPRIDGSAVFDL